MFRYLPEQASEFAPNVDRVNDLITDISLFFTVGIVGTMLYFAVKYRKRNGVDHETPAIEGSMFLEVLWTVVPSIICVVVAAYAYAGYDTMRNVPKDAMEIMVRGRQWIWNFQYPNGKTTSDEFVVPVGKPVKLVITSEDVLHSFFVPGMRTKVDAVPGTYTYQWFKPVKTGPQNVFCTEYCGDKHSQMMARMHVVSEAEYERWVNDKPRTQTPAELGAALYGQKACASCHSNDGSAKVGPTFLKLFGKKGKFDDGTEYVADENYLKNAILNANANIVQGYPKPSPMPSFQGQLDDAQIGQLIAFIKSLNEAPAKAAKPKKDPSQMPPVEYGKYLYENKACQGCHSLDGSKMTGPTFKGIYGKEGKFDDGTPYKADDAYIKESILKPQAHVVEGYPKPSPMPAYEGQLEEKDLASIIEFLKTVK